MSNVLSFNAAAKGFKTVSGGGGAGNSGEPPHNGGMEARVTALEEAVKNLPTKADLDELRHSAKADASSLRTDFEKLRADMAKTTGELRTDMAKGFGELRADMHKNSVDIQRWMIATVIGLFLGFGGLFLAMSNALKPSTSSVTQPTQQAPIIINVPSAVPSSTPQK
ncbi:hypothetical protein QRD40_10705 [Comamonas sp. Y6]|uniref:DUF1640 domain-containing protein n=1 Tax=Comamonas resistens TaxID=3046670 RepID=A0ABY8SWY8_9BURK|nr:hypothetical protein [Comamonas resistens]MDL5036816.1 hypothetical protein [Comamonas resistens]WHS67126.1 hypothetical protein QMY55_08420 [Comamonas resistens]